VKTAKVSLKVKMDVIHKRKPADVAAAYVKEEGNLVSLMANGLK